MGTWRLTDDGAERLQDLALDTEEALEDLLERCPELVFDGEPLLVIGRQKSTDLGRAMDLLAIDGRGRAVICELKKQRTPRDVVAQALEYASYVAGQKYAELDGMATEYFRSTGKEWANLAEAFEGTFRPILGETDSGDIVWNGAQRIAIVAEEISGDIARVCRYLREGGLDISAIEIRHLHSPSGERIVTSQAVVGREDIGLVPPRPTTEAVEARIPQELKPLFDIVRSAAAQRYGLREHPTTVGFGFEPVPNPRQLVLAGLYLSGTSGRAGLYVYRRATEELGGDIEKFYRRVAEMGFDTQGLPETAINLTAADAQRLDQLWDAFDECLMGKAGQLS
jgi:hypothetical protein